MKLIMALCLCALITVMPSSTFAAQGDTDQVLRGIPAIAKVFAPVGDVKWEEFAQVLAGICAVESRCDPTYPHYTQNGSYSQYQGLFQMNMHEVGLAEQQLPQMLQRAQALVASGQIPQDAFQFVQQAVQQANGIRGTNGDRRFLPAYGIILGATKHIQINKQLAERFPGDPIRQAAGHLTAQFSGITQGKIRARQFNALISGSATQVNTEAWALGVNRVNAQGLTVAGAIEAAGAQYQARMRAMMNRMAQITNNLSLVPPNVAPFTPPQYNPGSGPLLNVPYSGVSTMMEAGLIPRTLAPSTSHSQGLPASVYNAATRPQPSVPGTGAPSEQSNALWALQAIVQPQAAKPGQMVLVSWTSVGVAPNACKIRIKNDIEIARTNTGTQSVALPVDAPAGNVTFEFSCNLSQGEVYTTETSVRVIP